MCNLGEMIARENIEKGHSMGLEQGLVQVQKLERRKKNIEHVTNLMSELQCSMQRAMDVLKLTADERKDVEEYFKSQNHRRYEFHIAYFLLMIVTFL